MSDTRRQSADVAHILSEIAALMELNGRDPFRTRAFAGAARALEGTDADLAALARDDQLTSLPGIGPAISAIVSEIIETGRSSMRDELAAATPVGLIELLRVPGLGTKRIIAAHKSLGVDSLDSLEAAARSGELGLVSGIGPKTAQRILAGLEFARLASGRRRYPDALVSAARLHDWASSREEVQGVEIVGPIRRRLEVIDSIDLVVASTDIGATLAGFSLLHGVRESERSDPETATGKLGDGLKVRLRCVTARDFVVATVWETGSSEHLDALTARASELGMRLDDSSLKRGRKRLELNTEESLYSELGLAYIPPELREGLGEVTQAMSVESFPLVEPTDLRGTFHCHTTYSDGTASVAEMAEGARDLGWSYLGIADHSQSAAYAGGLPVEKLELQQAEIEAWNAEIRASIEAEGAHPPFRLFKGVESDILPDGSLDYPDDVLASFDYVVGSVHSAFAMSREQMTERMVRALRNPYLTILGHATGRLLLNRKGYDLDIDRIIQVAKENGVIIEINADPRRLDLDWRHVRDAAARGVLIAINPDAHSVAGIGNVVFGVNMARKAGLVPEQVLNCWSLERVERYFAERKQARQA